jgi:hypothetical protein
MNSPAGGSSCGVFFAMFALTNFGFGFHFTPKAPDIVAQLSWPQKTQRITKTKASFSCLLVLFVAIRPV